MKTSMIGTGYVGLVSGTCFSEMGIITSCLDIDSKGKDNLKQGIMPFWEPGLKQIVKRKLGDRISYTNVSHQVLDDADAIFLVDEWKEFRVLNFPIFDRMKTKIIFDGRNIYDHDELRDNGFLYYGIGRK
jgi:UDP-glucose 6-dehydrogenase